MPNSQQTYRALIRIMFVLFSVMMMLTLAIGVVSGVFIIRELNDASCFRTAITNTQKIGKADRQAEDALNRTVHDVLTHKYPDALQRLQNAYAGYSDQRSYDEAQRVKHPIRTSC